MGQPCVVLKILTRESHNEELTDVLAKCCVGTYIYGK
jgi:hypothetical protein